MLLKFSNRNWRNKFGIYWDASDVWESHFLHGDSQVCLYTLQTAELPFVMHAPMTCTGKVSCALQMRSMWTESEWTRGKYDRFWLKPWRFPLSCESSFAAIEFRHRKSWRMAANTIIRRDQIAVLLNGDCIFAPV